MPFTNFPYGVTSFGVPIAGGLPLLEKESKIFFVDAENGNDGYVGTSRDAPLKTPQAAHTLAVDARGDVILVKGNCNLASTLAITKSRLHLLGLNFGGGWTYRSRLNAPTTPTTASVVVQARDVEIGNLYIGGNHDSGKNTPSIFLDGDNLGTRSHVHDCIFEQLTPTGNSGATAWADGILVIGDRHTIENCSFDSCRRGIDVYSGVQATFEVVIRNNRFRACDWMIAVRSLQVGTGQYGAWIEGNIGDASEAFSNAAGITDSTGVVMMLADNKILGYTNPIHATAAICSRNFDGTAGGASVIQSA